MRTQTSQLFVFEGANEVDKSTLAAMLTRKLRRENGACDLFAFPGNKTGTLGRHIHNLHHSTNKFGIKRIEATSLQLLHIAAHVDSITSRILPALRHGRLVVLDRYWWS